MDVIPGSSVQSKIRRHLLGCCTTALAATTLLISCAGSEATSDLRPIFAGEAPTAVSTTPPILLDEPTAVSTTPPIRLDEPTETPTAEQQQANSSDEPAEQAVEPDAANVVPETFGDRVAVLSEDGSVWVAELGGGSVVRVFRPDERLLPGIAVDGS